MLSLMWKDGVTSSRPADYQPHSIGRYPEPHARKSLGYSVSLCLSVPKSLAFVDLNVYISTLRKISMKYKYCCQWLAVGDGKRRAVQGERYTACIKLAQNCPVTISRILV